ncbi:beta-L-arabinofuranosidase domain-containing protein [Microbacterium amylolyticum]|uniref:DUF1680 family protein n=1 Tax=Microbacterium amylolyticum TaxID=936337 RepID=A0ABS4ZHG6_9MICO|nr:beta-L-arabinofuranosidase domain-containing protein [Microbacterium amylolyticum]MBP2436722.1 DUF1680 family protein [Microbacterium amylolyticum]
MKLFSADAVRITDGPFAEATQTDLDYALRLDADRLLAPFLREAGLKPKAPSYGNWEDSGLDGHIGGHWLSALALLYAATGEEEAMRRLRYAIGELERAQDAAGSGWLGGVPGGAALFDALREGGVTAARSLGSSTHWVPWYNLHKLFQGLLDAHTIAGDERALRMVVRLAEWWLDIAAEMSDEAFEAMLDTEFGAMNESFAELAALTGREDFAVMARRFSHRVILDPLLNGRDDLTGRHANTTIAKAVGYAANSDAALVDAAGVFWRTVVERRSVAIGGNSVREHFHPADNFAPMIDDREGPETCNTYNMLKLTRFLAERDARPELFDYAERALFNHVLSAQHPDGGFAYFTPMRPRHYRVYSQPHEGFWCCVGTGMEMQARYGEWLFGVEDGAIAVNLFAPAELNAAAFGVRLRMVTEFPLDDRVTLTIEADQPRAFPIRVRVPGWSNGLEDIRVNGEAVAVTEMIGAVCVDRVWNDGDQLTFRVPLPLRAEPLADGSPWQAYLAGPIVLAARDDNRDLDGLRADDSRMGHIAAGPLREVADMPLVEEGADALDRVKPLRYRLATTDPIGAVTLEPFAGIHDSRYTVYWPIATGPGRRSALSAHDAHLTIDAATVDSVTFGEQQPESDHAFSGDGAPLRVNGDQRWRELHAPVSFELRDPGWQSRRIHVRLRASEVPTAMAVSLGEFDFPVHEIPAGEDTINVVIAPPAPGTRIRLSPVAGHPTPDIIEARLLF